MRRVRPPRLALAIIAFIALLMAPTLVDHHGRMIPPRAVQAAQQAVVPQSLIRADVGKLPPAPLRLQLISISVAPGAHLPAYSRPGPQLDRVESGALSVTAQGAVTIARAPTSATPAATPQPGTEFVLRPGDQVLFPAQTSLSWRNAGKTTVKLLEVLILPVGHQHPPSIKWANGNPTADQLRGVTFHLLGDGRLNKAPSASAVVALDRLALAPGVSVPAAQGTAMLAIELGNVAFSLVKGGVQVSFAAHPGDPRFFATPGTNLALGAGDAALFLNGISEIGRKPEAGVAVILRLSLSAVGASPGLLPTATVSAPNPAPTATPSTVAPSPTIPPTPNTVPAILATEGPPSAEGEITAGASVMVTESGVRLRDSPSTEGEIVSELDAGQALIVTGDAETVDDVTWWPVQDPDDPEVAGYVADEYLALAEG